jgi:carbonic anhydrase
MCQLCDVVPSGQTSRRSFRAAAACTAAGLAFAPPISAKETKPPPKPQNVLAPDAALDRLVKGNLRYVEGVSRRHDFKHEREALATGQNPFAGILSCADSRIAPEYAFDTGRGDLFVCRVAGNFASDEMIASLEYGSSVLGVPLFMVLGHDSCGAVDAAIKSLKDNSTLPGHLPSLVSAITPAVKATEGRPGDRLANAIRQNVIDNVAKLKTATPILSAAVDQGKLRIVGAVYRLTDGKVELVADGKRPTT